MKALHGFGGLLTFWLHDMHSSQKKFHLKLQSIQWNRKGGPELRGIPKITLASCGTKLFLTTLDFQVPMSLSIRDETLFSPTTCFLRLITLKVVRVGIHLSSQI